MPILKESGVRPINVNRGPTKGLPSMAKTKRTIWDELMDIGKEIIDKIEETLNPRRRKPSRVPVPIPVRNGGRRPETYDKR